MHITLALELDTIALETAYDGIGQTMGTDGVEYECGTKEERSAAEDADHSNDTDF